MERKDAIAAIRRQIDCRDYLEKDRHNTGYCCPLPLCGSGKKENGTGAVEYYKNTNTWYCFACHNDKNDGRRGDVIDLHMNKYGMDFNTAVKELADQIGIEIDRNGRNGSDSSLSESDEEIEEWYARITARQKKFEKSEDGHALDWDEEINADPEPDDQTPPQRNETAENDNLPDDNKNGAENADNVPLSDFTEYYEHCRKILPESPEAIAYLSGRGISLETAQAYGVGFDPAADPANVPGVMDPAVKKPHPAPRIIIPTTSAHYVGRAIDPNTQKKFIKMNPKKASPGIFNRDAIYKQDPETVFIVEGAFDALSVAETGRAAIALNSTSNTGKLLELLEKEPAPKKLFLIAFDNDSDPKTAERTSKAAKELRSGLLKLGHKSAICGICGSYKDPNEYLQADRDSFLSAVKAAEGRAIRPDNIGYYMLNEMAGDIQAFKSDVKTGFANLDKETRGLYPGMYVIAAIPSLGKTTFAVQMADQIATAGNHVIFFSLEQSRLELTSSMISRRTYQSNPREAVNNLSIRRGYLPDNVLEASEELAADAGDRLSIVEGNFNCTVSFIRGYIERYIQLNKGTKPVIFIDYLQIIQPDKNALRKSAKEAIDGIVTELRRISRDYNLIIFVISSVNRQNYAEPFDYSSLKESGAIEYTADVIWGLQLHCLNDPGFAGLKDAEKRKRVKTEKAADPRRIELSCLKNRYGKSSFSTAFIYHTKYSFLEPDTGEGHALKWDDEIII